MRDAGYLCDGIRRYILLSSRARLIPKIEVNAKIHTRNDKTTTAREGERKTGGEEKMRKWRRKVTSLAIFSLSPPL